MNTNGLLRLGISEIVSRSTGKPIGYAFAEPNGKGIFERWLLFTNPRNDFEVRPAPDSMASWTLDDWQDNVSSLWQPGSYYVWAQADVYEYGATYGAVTWNQIPSSAKLPAPTFPNRSSATYQLDWIDGRLPTVRQGDVCGYAFVMDGLDRGSSVEYWFLPAAYVSTGASTSIDPTAGQHAPSIDAFVELANHNWQPGARLSITGCINYHGAAPPLVP